MKFINREMGESQMPFCTEKVQAESPATESECCVRLRSKVRVLAQSAGVSMPSIRQLSGDVYV